MIFVTDSHIITNSINEEQLTELEELIEKFYKRDIKIVQIGKIDSSLDVWKEFFQDIEKNR